VSGLPEQSVVAFEHTVLEGHRCVGEGWGKVVRCPAELRRRSWPLAPMERNAHGSPFGWHLHPRLTPACDHSAPLLMANVHLRV
jgi:hypothetical protein